MFERIASEGDHDAGHLAELSTVADQDAALADQRAEIVEDGTVQIESENQQYLRELRAIDDLLDVPGIVNEFNAKTRHVRRLKDWYAKCEPFSWAAHAPSMTSRQGFALDGVRAICGWRFGWDRNSDERPDEAIIALYQQQHEGEQLGPHLAVVPYLPAESFKPEVVGATAFTNLLSADHFVVKTYGELLPKLTQSYESLNNKQRGELIAAVRGLTSALYDPATPTPAKAYNERIEHELFDPAASLGWTQKPDSARHSMLILRKPFGRAVDQMREGGEIVEEMAKQPLKPEDLPSDGTWTSGRNLKAINELFARPRTELMFRSRQVNAEHGLWRLPLIKHLVTKVESAPGLFTRHAWPTVYASTLHAGVERERIAAALEDMLSDYKGYRL